VQEAEIQALRNHHDLLSTLYYASPPDHRPRVDLLQHLVDHARSHREACRVSVKAWANLAAYQVASSEGLEKLQPFLSWYRDIAQATLQQFRLARSEAEHDYNAAKEGGNTGVSESAL